MHSCVSVQPHTAAGGERQPCFEDIEVLRMENQDLREQLKVRTNTLCLDFSLIKSRLYDCA